MEYSFEDAKQALIQAFNYQGQLSLISIYHFYVNRGYNKFNLDYDQFCNCFELGLNEVCYNERNQIIPLIDLDKTLYMLTLYFNINVEYDDNNKIVKLC